MFALQDFVDDEELENISEVERKATVLGSPLAN
jgi:hypothetical protein